MDSAQSVVDFKRVLSRKELVLLYWVVVLILDCMHGIVVYPLTLTHLWCWTFPKDGVLRRLRWHLDPVSQLSAYQSTLQNASPPTLTGQWSHLLINEKGTMSVVVNFTTVACGKYLRINMTSTRRLYLTEIKVIGTSRYTFTDTRNLQDMLTLLLTSLNMSFSITDGNICTHPPPAVGDPTSPTTSVRFLFSHIYLWVHYTHMYCEYILQFSTHLTMWYFVTSASSGLSCTCVASWSAQPLYMA